MSNEKKLQEWVDIAGGIECPTCDNSGGYASYNYNGDVYQVQCQFCHECPDSKYNRNTRAPDKEKDNES